MHVTKFFRVHHADELEKRGYFNRLKSLVEDTYRRNGNTKVTLVVHSMGGLVSLHFLTGFSGINQAWKNTIIRNKRRNLTTWYEVILPNCVAIQN